MRGLTDAEAAFLQIRGEEVTHLRHIAEDLVAQGRVRIEEGPDGWDQAYSTPAGEEALRIYLQGIR